MSPAGRYRTLLESYTAYAPFLDGTGGCSTVRGCSGVLLQNQCEPVVSVPRSLVDLYGILGRWIYQRSLLYDS